jgi:mono/diheme cytochrome c family protein
MRKRFLLLVPLLACSGLSTRRPADGDALVIDGKLEGGAMGLTLADLARLPQRKLQGADPRAGRTLSFAGVALQPLLTELLPLRRNPDLAIFYGRGGYRVAVPFNAIRQSLPILALSADGKPVGDALEGAGPLLLAWPDAEAPGLDSDPRHRWWWVRAVSRVEIASWQESYGRALRVPPGASDEARHGAELFASQCIHCHRLRGQGGTVGPDLSGWLSMPDAPALQGVLRDHLQTRSGIPATPPLAPAQVQEVAAFLRGVQLSGADHAEEAPEPPAATRPPAPKPY